LAGASGFPGATHVRVAALAVDLPKYGEMTRMRSEEKRGMGKGPKWDLEGGSVAVVPYGHELLEGLEHVDDAVDVEGFALAVDHVAERRLEPGAGSWDGRDVMNKWSVMEVTVREEDGYGARGHGRCLHLSSVMSRREM